jgi:LysM repeat protein
MAGRGLDVPDEPACPFLGLAADRRSHFTFAHPAHRCYVKNHPATTDARRQVRFCLTVEFTQCDRYRSWQARQGSASTTGVRNPTIDPPPIPAAPAPAPFAQLTASVAQAPGPDMEPPGTVIHVFRTGDSLAGIAAKYGLTVGELSIANPLSTGASLVDGTRLVIPIDATPRRRSKTNRKPATGE